jgi:hypothetical protein
MTGSMPGIAASTSETWLFGSPPNSVEAPENSFDFEVTWACTSSPITTSQSPVWPLISFPGLTDTFIDAGFQQVEMWDGLGFAQRMTSVKPPKSASGWPETRTERLVQAAPPTPLHNIS